MGLDLRRHGPGHGAHPAYVRLPFLSSSLSSERNGLKAAQPATAEPAHACSFLVHLSIAPQCQRSPGKCCAGRQGEMNSSTCSYNDKRALSRTRIPLEAMASHSFTHTHTHTPTHTWLPAVLLITFPIKEGSAWGGGGWCTVRARLPGIFVVPSAQDKLLSLIQFLPPSPPPCLAS